MVNTHICGMIIIDDITIKAAKNTQNWYKNKELYDI